MRREWLSSLAKTTCAAQASSKEEARKVGIKAATEQCADLREHGVRYFHFYTLSQGDVVFQIVSNFGLQHPGQKRLEVQHS
ncbi:MAG: methylenetetrahydrofolate reductase [Chloroflexi bacterium]|nr:methylenetetrahydrofolate reductase [Chloroflexota bacterium]MBI3040593.1 methylenetetrahydrofolate reductase [Chloroflexota bacterium]